MNAATFDFPDGRVVLTVVDVGGQQSFFSLRNRFFEGAQHLILVYDMTEASTFDRMPEWFSALAVSACDPARGFLGGSLVANKADLSERRAVSRDAGEALARMLQFEYFETSAKTGLNVGELFLNAATSSRLRKRQLGL